MKECGREGGNGKRRGTQSRVEDLVTITLCLRDRLEALKCTVSHLLECGFEKINPTRHFLYFHVFVKILVLTSLNS